LDLEASSEVMFSSVGLLLAAVGRPPRRGVDGVFGLVADVEQASDLGQGQGSDARAAAGAVVRGDRSLGAAGPVTESGLLRDVETPISLGCALIAYGTADSETSVGAPGTVTLCGRRHFLRAVLVWGL